MLLKPSTWSRVVRGQVTPSAHLASLRTLLTAFGRKLLRLPSRILRRGNAQRGGNELTKVFDRLREQDQRALIMFAGEERLYAQLLAAGRLSGLERWPNISLEHVAFPGEMQTLRPLVLQREAHRLVDELLQRELERIGAQADPAPVELRPTGGPRSHSPKLGAGLLRPRLDLESMRSEQGERDPLHAEAQARRVRLRAAREL